jgi:hypothetical protein
VAEHLTTESHLTQSQAAKSELAESQMTEYQVNESQLGIKITESLSITNRQNLVGFGDYISRDLVIMNSVIVLMITSPFNHH